MDLQYFFKAIAENGFEVYIVSSLHTQSPEAPKGEITMFAQFLGDKGKKYVSQQKFQFDAYPVVIENQLNTLILNLHKVINESGDAVMGELPKIKLTPSNSPKFSSITRDTSPIWVMGDKAYVWNKKNARIESFIIRYQGHTQLNPDSKMNVYFGNVANIESLETLYHINQCFKTPEEVVQTLVKEYYDREEKERKVGKKAHYPKRQPRSIDDDEYDDDDN